LDGTNLPFPRAPENPEDFYDKNYYLSLGEKETIAPEKTFILNDAHGLSQIHR